MTRQLKFRILKSRLLFWLVCLMSGLTAVPLLAIIGKVLIAGYSHFNVAFFTEATPTALNAMLATSRGESIPGGIANGILGTLLMVGMAAVVAIPIGIAGGVYLSENRKSRFAQAVSYMTDLLQGTPSIIIGIITYFWVVVPMKGYSAVAGSVALAIMMLPLIIRSTEETMKMLPLSLKEAALALGSSYPAMVIKVLLPSAFGGIFTGVLLAVSRVTGETAPLMFTALGCAAINANVARPMSAVPLLIWEFFNDPNLQSLIWSASLFLLIFVLILNITSKQLAKRWRV